MESLAPGFVTRPLPVGRAGAAIVRGIERRSRRVYAPRWILPALLAPAIFGQPFVDRAPRGLTKPAIELADEHARSGQAPVDELTTL